MGAWGYGLFEDDDALDVRDEYRELIGQGVADDEAWRTVVQNNDADDPDSGPTVWLALAATQWKLGRLDPIVKDRALQIIHDGEGLELWREAGADELAARVRVLNRLASQLNKPQPEPKKIRPLWRYVTDLEAGDMLGRFDAKSQYCVWRVLRIEEHNGGADPIIQELWWLKSYRPTPKQLVKLRGIPVLRFRATRFHKKDKDWAACGFELLGNVPVPPRAARKRPTSTVAWSQVE
jgi:hypothetical protein